MNNTDIDKLDSKAANIADVFILLLESRKDPTQFSITNVSLRLVSAKMKHSDIFNLGKTHSKIKIYTHIRKIFIDCKNNIKLS